MAAVGGSIGVAFAISMITGPILANIWGLSGLFWLTAVLAVCGILVLMFVVPSPVALIHNAEAQAVPAMFSKLLRDGELLRLNLGIGILHFAQMASWVSVPLILEQTLSFGRDQHWMIYLGAMGLSFLCMLPFIILGEAKRKMKPVFVGAVVLLAIGEILLGTGSESRYWFLLGLFVFFMAFNLLEATLPSLVSKIAPAGGKGTAMGIYSTSQFLGAFLGGVTGGLVAYHFGYEYVFLMVAVLILLWVIAAATMKAPRHLKSLVVQLLPAETIVINNFVGVVSGVCDVVVIPDQQLAYFKVDMDEFSPEEMQKVLGRPIQV